MRAQASAVAPATHSRFNSHSPLASSSSFTRWNRLTSSTTTLKCKATDAAELTKLEMSPKLQERWRDSQSRLLELGLTDEEAERVLGKSSGHLRSPYWGENKEVAVPEAEQVSGIVEYLKSLGLSDPDLSTLLKKFPELLGCDLDDNIRKNVGILDSSWGITGKTLKALLLRKPQVLGFNVDCKGDCMAECTRCWARF